MVALSIGAVFHIYGKDLPSHEAWPTTPRRRSAASIPVEGRIIDEFARERRLFTPAEEIPDLVKQAFISAEDKNFYDHAGYDARGIAAAIWRPCRPAARTVRGASTITQQVMKNFLLSGDRRIERKIKEIILATRIEETLSKEKILELYLNEIFLGQNSYGVTAAAQTYFNKTLGELAPHEAAIPCRDAQGAVGLSPGAREGAAAGAAQFRPDRDVRERLYRAGDTMLRPRSTSRCARSRTAISSRSARACRRATISPTRSAAS